jgi:FAD/FMN-containing dehydrogenase
VTEPDSNVFSVKRATEALQERLGRDKVACAGPEYEKSRYIWNAAVTHRPELIVFCEKTSDVQDAVRVAVNCRLPLSVRSGGHDWAGRCVRGNLVVDLTRMQNVKIEGHVATVGGGATSTVVAEAVGARGFIAVTGIIGSVGMAGLATGGGYGHFTAKFGMASDNILGAEMVLADGRIVQVDEDTEPDLFWALRGGGGNFGVVTNLRLRLHAVTDVSDGIVAFPWEQATQVLASYQRLLQNVPDELTLMPTFFAASDGKLSLIFHYAWCGDRDKDEEMAERVKSLGTPSLVQLSRKTLAEILKEAEKRTMKGIHWIVRTVTLPVFSPEAFHIIQTAMENRSSPLSWIAAHPFYGAGEKVAIKSTAFGIRSRHFMVGIYAAWQLGDATPHRAWADQTEAALKPFALDSAYPNYFGTDRPEQAAQAYGPNSARLLTIKKHYDPDNVFAATSLPANPT